MVKRALTKTVKLSPDTKRVAILIVDDDPAIRRMLDRFLRKLGDRCEIFSAATGLAEWILIVG